MLMIGHRPRMGEPRRVNQKERALVSDLHTANPPPGPLLLSLTKRFDICGELRELVHHLIDVLSSESVKFTLGLGHGRCREGHRLEAAVAAKLIARQQVAEEPAG